MIQKTIQDYYEAIAAEYPEIPIQDIKRILQYGWKSLYLHNRWRCPITQKKFLVLQWKINEQFY